MNDEGRAAIMAYYRGEVNILSADDTLLTPPACPAPDAVPGQQLYAIGVPFVPRDSVPMTDDEVREWAVGVGQFGYVMFDKVRGV